MTVQERRIREICRILNNKQNKIDRIDAIKELLDARDIKVSRKTIQNDIAYLRNIEAPIPANAGKGNIAFNFEIPYSYELEGLLSYQEKESLELVRSLMEQYCEIQEFENLRLAINKVLGSINYEPESFVQPEIKPLRKGFQYFKTLYTAIKNETLVDIMYFANYEPKAKPYTIEPLLLKESSGMWYCIGRVNNSHLRTFSIDRITRLEISTKTKSDKSLENESGLYDYQYVFGIVKPENINKPTVLKIAFEKSLGEMLENRPLHPTQVVIDGNEKEIIMQYEVLYSLDQDKRIMRELHRELCKYAGSLRIIEPVELRNEIYSMLKEGLELNS